MKRSLLLFALQISILTASTQNLGNWVVHNNPGSFKLHSGNDQAPIRSEDAFSTRLNQKLHISNTGSTDPELLVNGISIDGKSKPSLNSLAAKPSAMVLQMDFVVTPANSEAFEKMYHSIYVPAMLVQQGYLSSKLLRMYPAPATKQIEGETTDYNYQIQISFDTEENRRKWVASAQHQIAWPAATSLAKSYKWRGYDVAGDNEK